MVASNRGLAAIPRWLVEEYAGKVDVLPLRLGDGLRKKIHLGIRKHDLRVDYIEAFFSLARSIGSRLPARHYLPPANQPRVPPISPPAGV